jgi:hypothetical protein
MLDAIPTGIFLHRFENMDARLAVFTVFKNDTREGFDVSYVCFDSV